METRIGGMTFEFHHARGETDDETWVWCQDNRVLCTGDTFVWCSPNAGNPYKVQRYARDWADALEQMAAKKPLHLLPGHGPAISDEGTIEEALLSSAHLLRSIHDQVVAGMNDGKLARRYHPRYGLAFDGQALAAADLRPPRVRRAQRPPTVRRLVERRRGRHAPSAQPRRRRRASSARQAQRLSSTGRARHARTATCRSPATSSTSCARASPTTRRRGSCGETCSRSAAPKNAR